MRIAFVVSIAFNALLGALIAWVLIRDAGPPIFSQRQTIILPAPHRDVLLAQMRYLLGSVREILEATNLEEYDRAARAARAAGSSLTFAMATKRPGIVRRLPPPYRRLGSSMHSDFDHLAELLESGEPNRKAVALAQLANTMKKCTACHSSYAFVGRAQAVQELPQVGD